MLIIFSSGAASIKSLQSFHGVPWNSCVGRWSDGALVVVQVLSLTQDILVDFQGNSLTLRVTDLEVAKGPAEPADPSALKEEEVLAVPICHLFRPSLVPSQERAGRPALPRPCPCSWTRAVAVSSRGPTPRQAFRQCVQGLHQSGRALPCARRVPSRRCLPFLLPAGHWLLQPTLRGEGADGLAHLTGGWVVCGSQVSVSPLGRLCATSRVIITKGNGSTVLTLPSLIHQLSPAEASKAAASPTLRIEAGSVFSV